MLKTRIIYGNEDGTVGTLIPAESCGMSVEEIASKDVPAGRPWRIVSASDLPPRDSRQRWRWTDSGPLSVAEETP